MDKKLEQTTGLQLIIAKKFEQRFKQRDFECRRFADRIFSALFAVQYVAAIVAAIYVSPKTWIGAYDQVHFHVWLAIFGGAVISFPPMILSLLHPGARANQYVNACSQVITSSLLIHLSGGRIETHFHVFGSVAFLSLYRNWIVLVPATAIVALDHVLRSNYWPESAFGVTQSTSWRWLEHAGWLVFEDIVLVVGTIQSRYSLRIEAKQWAEIAVTKQKMDDEIARQVSDIAASQELLRHQERRMKRVIDSAQDGFLILDQRGMITYWSDRAESLVGWTAGEVVGKPLTSIVIKCLQSEFLLSDVRLDGQNRRGIAETEMKSKNGEIRIVELSYFVNDEDRVSEVNVFLHDITRRKAEQLQLAHLRKMESIGQLAAGIAHEINTPSQFIGDNLEFVGDTMEEVFSVLEQLQTTLSSLDSVEKGRLEPLAEKFASLDFDYIHDELPKAVEQAKEGNKRVGTITKAMKEFSHPGTIHPIQTDLGKLIESSLVVCRNAWKSEADVSTFIDPAIGQVDCFANELSQSIINLVVNAAQAIGEQRERTSSMEMGKINIEARKLSTDVEIRVEDNGPGIPDDIRGRVFDPFFTTKEVGKGTGQGLAITHSAIVDKHKGTIRIESELGKGTAFVLRIPLHCSTDLNQGNHCHV